MTRCEYCSHEFTNILMRRTCPRCGQSLKRPAEAYTTNNAQVTKEDEGFDATGFAVGMMTGIPLSPSRGFSTGALLGAALHSEPSHSSPSPAPDPSPAPSCDTSSSYSSSSSSYDSSSSSSSSYDSGSSSSSSCDSGGSW